MALPAGSEIISQHMLSALCCVQALRWFQVSYITAIWTRFSQRRNLSDIRSENRNTSTGRKGLRQTRKGRISCNHILKAASSSTFCFLSQIWTVNTVDLLCPYRLGDITLPHPILRLSVGCLRVTLQCCHSDLRLSTCPDRSGRHWPGSTAATEDITWGFYPMEPWAAEDMITTPTVRRKTT